MQRGQSNPIQSNPIQSNVIAIVLYSTAVLYTLFSISVITGALVTVQKCYYQSHRISVFSHHFLCCKRNLRQVSRQKNCSQDFQDFLCLFHLLQLYQNQKTDSLFLVFFYGLSFLYRIRPSIVIFHLRTVRSNLHILRDVKLNLLFYLIK